MAADLKLTDPAELYRSRADFREEMRPLEREKIGEGDLAKMIRLALSDPDEEIWRYAIRVGDQNLEGEDIFRQNGRLVPTC